MPHAALIIETTFVVLAALTYLHVRYWPCPLAGKTDMGLWMMMINSAGIALLETWAYSPSPEPQRNLSWVSIVILVSAMVAPGRPRRMLAAALVSASLGPIGMWLAYLRGVDVPTMARILLMALPNFAFAVVAVLPAQMFERMGRRPSRRSSLPISREVDQLVLDCLKKNPQDRPRDAMEILSRIQSTNLAKAWSGKQAQTWWRAHLPELAGS